MSIKKVDTVVCDYCEETAMPSECGICGRDVCYQHGACYRPHAVKEESRPSEFTICDECVKNIPHDESMNYKERASKLDAFRRVVGI